MAQRVLILGGAGFLGSHLAQRFAEGDWRVTVIDGLMPRTGGQTQNLNHLLPPVELITKSVESLPDLQEHLARANIVIDAMAWTAHLLALKEPHYDLQLNVASHLTLLEAMRSSPNRRVIYLGSRGQYGNPADDPVVETTAMEPRDIQGIHKLTAESYFRVLSPLHGIDAISLRLPNCFGERQPVQGDDIGLIGSFIRDSLRGQPIQIFGRHRHRCMLYAGDLAEIVFKLANMPFTGFVPVNTGGHHVSIAELAETIVRLSGSGVCEVKPIPYEIQAIDSGSARFSSARLESLIGMLPCTSLELALNRTITWFRNNCR